MVTVSRIIDQDLRQLIELTTTQTFHRIDHLANLNVVAEHNDTLNGEALFFDFDYLLESVDKPIHLSMGIFQVVHTKWLFKKQSHLSLIIREQVDKTHLTKNPLAERVINVDVLRSLDRRDAILEVSRIVREQLSVALSCWADTLDAMGN
ncbi:hypothetical protein K6U39_24245 [Vibrio parahaemolyticus]|nr:hypothetical protein [Vibrio parahaemolyticus]MCG6528886.1 hypothetical protein [Vibrio parahaemolyticus]